MSIWRRAGSALSSAFSRGRARLAATTEKLGKVIARVVRLWEAGRPAIVEGDRVKIADEGYRKASLIHACVTQFATSIAEPPLQATRYGKVLTAEDDLLADLAARINRDTTPYGYMNRVGSDLKVHGEAIVHKLRSSAGIIRELWPLRVDRMEVIPKEGGGIQRYEQWAGGVVIDKIDPDDIMHIKLYNPLNDYRGLSPIYVLMVEGTLDQTAILYLTEFFHSGGIPSVVITSSEEITPTERKTIVADFKDQYGKGAGVLGSTGYGDPFVLGKGGTIQAFGIDPSKLDMSAILDVSESRICAVMQVPAIIAGAAIGLRQSQAYGTAREARRGWWGETLSPCCEWLSQIHTKEIAREFGAGYQLRLDLSRVQALLEARGQIMRDGCLAFVQNVITLDQALERAGYPPEGGKLGKMRSYELRASVGQPQTVDPNAAPPQASLPRLVQPGALAGVV